MESVVRRSIQGCAIDRFDPFSTVSRITKTAYDAEGRVGFASYPLSSTTAAAKQAGDKGTTTNYDALGRVIAVSQDSEFGSIGTTTSYEPGFITVVTNPNGYSTISSYLTYDQPTTDWPLIINAPEGQTTTIARDAQGKPTSLTRSGGGVSVTRSYTYNGYQELCKAVEPETQATLFSYDGAGNLTASAAGQSPAAVCGGGMVNAVGRGYDNRNRLTSLNFPDGNGNQTWTYTPDGLPSTVTTYNDGNTVTNGYSYNNRRLLTGESMVPDTEFLGWAMGYNYNSLGHVTQETYPASVSVSYSVNALGQTTGITANSDSGASTTIVSSASYFPNGALKQFTYGNGIVHTMTQNARLLPSRSTDCAVSGTCSTVSNRKLDLAYGYDRNGNVTGITDGTTSARQSRTMSYDQLDRLTSVASSMFGNAAYTYDAVDNLKQVNISGGTNPRDHYYCYNASTHQLDFVRSGPVCTGAADPAVTALGYDVRGNLANKNGTGYTFDYGNRLRSTAGLTYRYDAEGRRVKQENAGTQRRYGFYARDGRLVWQRDEPASKRISNLYLAGSLVAEYSRPIGSQTVTVQYLHTDALGSPIAKTDASKAIIETSEYEPYGKLLNRANDDRAGYTGHVMDSASGLTYMQQRYYDPQIGRFLSVDPVTANSVSGANFNRYWYANNNPYRFTDPDGRLPADCPSQGTCVVRGTPQSTGTAGHAEASQNIGEKMKASGQYAEIHYNRAQSSVAGDAGAGLQRADVAGVTHSGKIDTVEITSPSQSTAQMDAKGAAMQGKLAPDARGVHKSYSIAGGLSPEAAIPRAGTTLSVAGVVTGVLNALVGLKSNPNMSQQEMLVRMAGIPIPVAQNVGLLPPPPPPQKWN